MDIYLVRHTQVAMPKGICYGSTDVELAPSFESEAEAVKQKLSGISFGASYSSPLTRCQRLAQQLTDSYVVDHRLSEYTFGDWECLPWDTIYAQPYGKRWFNDYVNVSTPNGESYIEMTQRIKSFIEALPSLPQPILIVTHAGIIRSFLVQLMGYTVGASFDRSIAYGEVVRITL